MWLAASANLDGVGSPKTPGSEDDLGKKLDSGKDLKLAVTLEPYVTDVDESKYILFVKNVPLDWSFDIIHREFTKFGVVREIRNRLGERNKFFETWISFVNARDAARALREFGPVNMSMCCSLVDSFPLYLDIYRPPDQIEEPCEDAILRSPEPPRWLIITTHGERGNLFRMKKLINQKLGQINRPDIKRFGRNSFLIHTKSDGQAVMLLNMKKDSECIIKEIKPHFMFSYAKGVIFNEDVHGLSEEEILEMCPDNVWKIFKVPRSSMIVITFVNSTLPNEIIMEKEIMRVRPYRPRVLQCYNCYQFGHASRVCVGDKVCQNCSQPEHGECDRSKKCTNCKGSHHARDKTCKVYIREQEALLKSVDEHISVGHAKKLLAKNSYSDVVKRPKSAIGGNTPNNGGAIGAPCGGAPRSSLAGASQAFPGGASCGPSGVDSRASSGGAPRASSGGAPRASSGGAPRAPPGGVSGVLGTGTRRNSLEIIQTCSPDIEIGSASLDSVGSGARAGSLNDLDDFSLPELLPGRESSTEPDAKSPMVIVHRSKDDEEQEALSVRYKRPRAPSSHSSSRSSSCDKNNKNDRTDQGPLAKKSASLRSGQRKNEKETSLSLSSGQTKKEEETSSSLRSGQRRKKEEETSSLHLGQGKSDKENTSNKISLSRSLIPKLEPITRKFPKSK